MDVRRRNISGYVSTSYNGSGGSSGNIGGNYTIDLNNQWQKSTTVSNPDATEYDGVYESFSNYNIGNTAAIMKITIDGYSSFKFYIRSYAESSFDYVMVSQLDQTIDNNTSYSNTTLVKAHTRANQQSGTALSNYTPIEFTNIDGGKHVITIVYRKDNSVNNGTDRGYVLIPKLAGDGGESGGSVDINNYLTIVALEDGLTASLSTNACEYCIDGDGNWLSLTAYSTSRSVNTGHTLSFRGNLTPATNVGIGTFTISKKCNLEGNCMSMLFGDNAANSTSLTGKDYAFYKLFCDCKNIVSVSKEFLRATTVSHRCYQSAFSGCSGLTNAPGLPATTLAVGCYVYMFQNCTSLNTVPSTLPAMALIDSCYGGMFWGCTSLTAAPELPALTLVYNCYSFMFYGCSKLSYIKMLATDISSSSCLSNWVDSVASTGTFVKNPNMTSLPTGISGIPSGWTVIDNVEFPITLEEGDNDVNGINVFGYLVNKYNGVNTRLTREYITEQITVNGSDTRYNGDVVVIMGNTYDSDGSVLSLKMATQSIINAEGDSGWMGSLYFILNSDGILSFYND